MMMMMMMMKIALGGNKVRNTNYAFAKNLKQRYIGRIAET